MFVNATGALACFDFDAELFGAPRGGGGGEADKAAAGADDGAAVGATTTARAA